MKFAVRKELTDRAHFCYAIRIAFDIFMSGEFAIFELEGANAHEARGSEIVNDNALLLVVPEEQGFTAVSAVINRMQASDCLAVQRPLLPSYINSWVAGF